VIPDECNAVKPGFQSCRFCFCTSVNNFSDAKKIVEKGRFVYMHLPTTDEKANFLSNITQIFISKNPEKASLFKITKQEQETYAPSSNCIYNN